MFAGIAIALSRPLRIGDWVKIGNLDEGKGHRHDLAYGANRDQGPGGAQRSESLGRPTSRWREFQSPQTRCVRISEAIYFPQSDDPTLIQDIRPGDRRRRGRAADPKPAALYRAPRTVSAKYTMRYFPSMTTG